MPLDPDRRRLLQQRTGLTEEQIRETTGALTVDMDAARANGLTDAQTEAARTAVQDIMSSCTIISAAYNQIAVQTDRNAIMAADPADLVADRAVLEDSFTKDYRLSDPEGNIVQLDETLTAIFSGRIRKESFGRGGFETLNEEFHVQRNSAISIGVFRMNATQMARNVRTGEVSRRPRVGTYRSTHTYVFDGDRWRLAASQLTLLRSETPSGRAAADWVFIND